MEEKIGIKKTENPRESKNIFREIWDFLWNSNSIWSWIIDIILVFLLVKFVIFPLCALALATPLPFVIIESQSMEHEGTIDQWFALHGSWYTERNITLEEIEKWPWSSGLYKGDIIIVKGAKDYSKGDVIIFYVAGQKTPIIHRVINVNTDGTEIIFSTKGDRNDGQLPYEPEIHKEQIVGKAIAQIPRVGWIKLFFVELFR